MVDVVATLASVALGGVLVLIGDVIRRNAEWKRDQVQRLVDAAVHLIALHHRAAGDLMESRTSGSRPDNVDAGKGERLDAIVRFFAMPGSDSLGGHYIALRESHRAFRRSYDDDATWKAARAEYMKSVRSFERALQDVRTTGRIPAQPLSDDQRRQLEEYRYA